MAVISFTEEPENAWVMAGWVVRQVLDDTLSQHPNDSAMASEFEYAKENSGILVCRLEPELAARVTSALRNTVTGILSGTIRSDIEGIQNVQTWRVEGYKEALRELLPLIPPDRV